MIDNYMLACRNCGIEIVKANWKMMKRRGCLPAYAEAIPVEQRPEWVIRFPKKRREQKLKWLRIAYPGMPEMRRFILSLHNSKCRQRLNDMVKLEYARLEGFENVELVSLVDKST